MRDRAAECFAHDWGMGGSPWHCKCVAPYLSCSVKTTKAACVSRWRAGRRAQGVKLSHQSLVGQLGGTGGTTENPYKSITYVHLSHLSHLSHQIQAGTGYDAAPLLVDGVIGREADARPAGGWAGAEHSRRLAPSVG